MFFIWLRCIWSKHITYFYNNNLTGCFWGSSLPKYRQFCVLQSLHSLSGPFHWFHTYIRLNSLRSSRGRGLSGAPEKSGALGSSLVSLVVNPRTPRGVSTTPLAFFPCNFFDDSNGENRLIVSVTRDGRHVLAYATSSWRCHVTYVMTSYVHDGGQNTLFLLLLFYRDNFWCICDKVIRLVSFSTKLRSQNPKIK